MEVDGAARLALALKMKRLGAHVDDLDILLQTVKRHMRVTPNEDLVRESHGTGNVRILLTGTTCSYQRKEEGSRTILSFQHPGDFCDLHRYLLPNEAGVGIQALAPSTVAVIDYRDMDRLLTRPSLATAFWRASVLEAAIYRERLTKATAGALERVAHLLSEQLARREAVGILGTQMPFSQIDIADAAGLSVVHVNRTIQTLRSLKVLRDARQTIEVVDRKQLEKIGGFDGRYLDIPPNAAKWAVQVTPTYDRATSVSQRKAETKG